VLIMLLILLRRLLLFALLALGLELSPLKLKVLSLRFSQTFKRRATYLLRSVGNGLSQAVRKLESLDWVFLQTKIKYIQEGEIMNVSGFISGLKQKVRDRETRKANDVAVGLAQLKKDRVRVEGQKKLYSIRASEISKTKKAKSDLRMLKQQSSVLGRATISIQKNVKDNKKKDLRRK